MAFDTLTKAIRLLVGRRYTSTDLTDSQEAFASTIQMGTSEIWSQINLIPSASLPYSSSATPGTTTTSGVLKYWYRWPLTVANNTATGSSVWYFTSPTGSAAGIGSQLIDGGQQINFISPKYVSDSNIVNQSADAGNNGNPPGYNIALFTSADGVTFSPLSPSASYQFDYKSGILTFTTTTVPSNRVYATVYQYVGRMLSDPNDLVALSITASNISASGYISSSAANFNTLTSNLSTLFNVTASNITASGYISASTLNSTNLVSTNNILTNITSSNISASGNISSSTANINTITSNLINSVSGSFSNISASKITGGTTQLDTLSVLGNSTFYGDLTVYGSSSIVNISSSTVIIGDNRIQLNAWSTGSFSQRYAGLDLTDSGSNNNVTSSLLWDSLNNYWLLTNNQTGSNPIVTSSALILQGPISNFGNEKQLPINTFLKVESTIGNLTSSNLIEVGSLLTYNGTISSSAISASSAFFNLDVLIGGVLKVFNKIYAYAGIIGDITGSLSGSSIITNTITASIITSSTIRTGNAQIDGGNINNTVIGNITPSTGNFTYITASTISSSTLISNNNTLVNVTSSNISASGYISGSSANFTNLSSVNNILTYVTSSNISASGNITGSNVYVENTITADTGSFIYLNLNNTGSAPTNYTSSGMPGEIRIDNNFIYIYTNNVWVRTPIVRWTT